MSKISVIIPPCENGLYNDVNNFDDGEFTDEMLKFIKTYGKKNINLPQFFVTQIKDPFRFAYRLPLKNITKSQKILDFFKNDAKSIDWLIDPDYIMKVSVDFCYDFGKFLTKKYEETKNLDNIIKLMDGIDWTRPEVEYNKLFIEESNTISKKIIGLMIDPLLDAFSKNNNVDDLDNKIKFYHLLKLRYNDVKKN